MLTRAMPGIIAPHGPAQQRNWPYAINYADPSAEGIEYCWVPGPAAGDTLMELVTGAESAAFQNEMAFSATTLGGWSTTHRGYTSGDDYVDLGVVMVKGRTDFLLASWCVLTAHSSTSHGALFWEGSSSGNGFGPEDEFHLYARASATEGLGCFMTTTGGFVQAVALQTDVPTLEPMHLAARCTSLGTSSPKIDLFVNGVQKATDTGGSAVDYTGYDTDARIGRMGTHTQRGWPGEIWDVRLYDGIYSDAFIARLADAGSRHNLFRTPGRVLSFPVAAVGVDIAAPLGTFTLAGLVPAAASGASAASPAGAFTLAGQVPAVGIGAKVDAPAGAFTLAGQVPSVGVTVDLTEGGYRGYDDDGDL